VVGGTVGVENFGSSTARTRLDEQKERKDQQEKGAQLGMKDSTGEIVGRARIRKRHTIG